MNRVASIIPLCLLAGTAYATFEIKDPANQIMDELQKEQEEKADQQRDTAGNSATQVSHQAGNTPCSDFVSYQKQGGRNYRESLDWMVGFIEGARYQQAGPQGTSGSSVNLDAGAVSAWTVGYCQENLQNKLVEAAAVFIDEFSVSD
jgi:hypothetical protein